MGKKSKMLLAETEVRSIYVVLPFKFMPSYLRLGGHRHVGGRSFFYRPFEIECLSKM